MVYAMTLTVHTIANAVQATRVLEIQKKRHATQTSHVKQKLL
jgi:hypothetical protein